MKKIDKPEDFLEKMRLEGKIRDLTSEEYQAIYKFDKEMEKVKREYILMEERFYIDASKCIFTA